MPAGIKLSVLNTIKSEKIILGAFIVGFCAYFEQANT